MYLNCHSYYSLRYGTFSENELLELAKSNNISCLALTDINNTSACLNFIKQAEKYNIKPLVGIDFRNGAKQQFVGIAKNNTGFYELNYFLSQHLENKQYIANKAPEFQNAFVIYSFENVLEYEITSFRSNEFIGVSVEELRKLPFSKLKNLTDKLVIQQPVTIRNKKDFNAHRLLRAIDNNCLLSKLPTTEECLPTEKMLSKEDLLHAFSSFPHIIENTKYLINQCQIHFGFGAERSSQNLKIYKSSLETDFEYLKKLCFQGLPKRYKNPDKKVYGRLNKELEVIKSLDFVSFFLINHDIISYAKHQGYFHVGRGSGANSMVAYIIGITDVDPIELDLYFERFINPSRKNPPDFDIDFSWRDRADVTRYIFEQFPKAALQGSYSTFKDKSAKRELGKVLGLPAEEIEKLNSRYTNLHSLDYLSKLVLKYSSRIQGFPNHTTVHSSGILIPELDIHSYSATFLPPKGF